MKIILIIGAGRSQIPAIISAKKMGLTTVAVDGNQKAPGLSMADYYEICDTYDGYAAMKIAEKYAVNGVVTIATDSGVMAAAMVTQYLGLPGVSVETARIATDKSLQRKIFAERSVPSVDFGVTSTADDIHDIAERIQFPLIVKPVDRAGKLGISKVTTPEELNTAFNYAKAVSRSGKVILEQFMVGPEVSVESLTFKGKTRIIAITDKMTTSGQYCVEIGHTIPSELPKSIQGEVCQVAIKGLASLGLQYGGGHAEIIITQEGPKIVEIGARLGGWIAADMVSLATGVDMVEGVINIAMAVEPDTTPKFNRGVALRIVSSRPGIVSRIYGQDRVKDSAGVIISEVFIKEGETIRPLRNGFDRIGRVVAVGRNRQEAVTNVEEAIKLFDIELVN